MLVMKPGSNPGSLDYRVCIQPYNEGCYTLCFPDHIVGIVPYVFNNYNRFYVTSVMYYANTFSYMDCT